MKTPKCPVCGAPLKAIRGYDVQGITTDWVAGCYNCFFQSSHFWKTKKACIEDMDRLVSLFPPIMRVQPGDKVFYSSSPHPATVVSKNINNSRLKIKDDVFDEEFVLNANEIDKWPWEIYCWELEQKGGDE